jgi:hypothetical protein
MSEGLQTKNLKSLVTQMENDWQELKKLLQRQQGEPRVQHHLDLQALGQPGGIVEESIQEKTLASQLHPEGQPEIKKATSIGAVTPMEDEAIVHRLKEVHRDIEVLDRLAKLEKQNRRIAVMGSMFLTMLALAMSILAYLMVQPHLWGKINLLRAAQGVVSTKPSDAEKAEQKVASSEGEALFKYVGSTTSDKYHYPDCKWAKQIAPERLVTFKSVEEAKEEGYVQCPVCKPPISD